MEYFVSPKGDDANPGTKKKPFRTIKRGLRGEEDLPTSTLKPGDILTLRKGIYLEAVKVINQTGMPGDEITIRSFSGERVVIDSGIADFRTTGAGSWLPAKTVDPNAHDDEWVSKAEFPQVIKPNRGAFLDMPYRRLVTYSTTQDFRAENHTFGKRFDVEAFDPKRGPYKVTDDNFVPLVDPGTGCEFTFPWVYMGPGLRLIYDEQTQKNRVHVRLSHTKLDIPGLENYLGLTDPNQVPLAICLENVETLHIENSSFLIFSNLTIRFGGSDTILIKNCESLTFDEVAVFASAGGIRFGALTGATFRNCRFDGGLPPWFFRTDRKAEYDCLLTKQGQEPFHNALGKKTIDVLMYGEGTNKQDFEIHHCEFVNGHDLYLVAKNTHFHHNWIDNLHDEGMVLDSLPSASGKIHSNVVTRCLSAVSLAGGFSAGPWSIFRNLIDLRQPTAGRRPHEASDQDVFRFGNTFKSNESPSPDGPHDLFHNTFLVAEQGPPAAYLHYFSSLSPHLRRSFNNIFIAVNPNAESDVFITFIPPPTFPGPTDGNLYHRFGMADKEAFKSLGYKLDGTDYEAAKYADIEALQASTLFTQSQTQYAPGYERHGLLTDPKFRKIGADGSFHPSDDLRLRAKSPARSAGVELPPDLQALDDEVAATENPAPMPMSRDIGCYRFGSKRLKVGVHGKRQFPHTGPLP